MFYKININNLIYFTFYVRGLSIDEVLAANTRKLLKTINIITF